MTPDGDDDDWSLPISNSKSSNGLPKLMASAAGPTHDLYSNVIVPESEESNAPSLTTLHPLQTTPACPSCG
jgi:hypothetical protein